MSSLHEATIRLSLQEFSRHGGLTAAHKDGWGVAYFAGKDVRIIKDSSPASGSPWIAFLQAHPPKSTIVVSHIRLATQGEHSVGNSQPFSRELAGRQHVFAHNGDLQAQALQRGQRLGLYHPVGETDSEYAFCALLERKIDRATCVELVTIATRQYAKRQLTWFRAKSTFPVENLSPVTPDTMDRIARQLGLP